MTMTKLDPSLFSNLVESYLSEFGELFQIADEQRDTFDRNKEILMEISEADKSKLCDTDHYVVASDFGVVSSDHPIALMGINILQWMIRKTTSYLKTYERTYQLALSNIGLLSEIIRVVFIIVGTFKSALEDGSYIPNNNLCRSTWEEVIVSMEKMYQLIRDAVKLFLEDFHLNAKYEVPNKIQTVDQFASLKLPVDSLIISKRHVNILTEIAETMLANFSEFAFVVLLSCRECTTSEEYDLFVDVTDEVADEAKDIIIKLQEKWADFIKYSEEENSVESNPRTAQDDYIKRVKHSKEYIILKDTSKLRQNLREFDNFLETFEIAGFDMINKSVPSDQIAHIFHSHSKVYQQKIDVLKSALERHELQFQILTKEKHQKLNPTEDEDTRENCHAQENAVVGLPENVDEIPKLEYENEAVEYNEQVLERDTNVGDEFFQTKGGLKDFKLDECVKVDEDSREQEKLFKFVVRELKGKLSDVSAVMKEREKKAKRKIYGEESSSDEEEDSLILISKQGKQHGMSKVVHDLQSTSKNLGFELKGVHTGISDPEPLHQDNSLACEGFPVFLNSELRNAINLRLKQCVAEEFEYSDDDSEVSNN